MITIRFSSVLPSYQLKNFFWKEQKSPLDSRCKKFSMQECHGFHRSLLTVLFTVYALCNTCMRVRLHEEWSYLLNNEQIFNTLRLLKLATKLITDTNLTISYIRIVSSNESLPELAACNLEMG
jgi:hypothetical protein